MLRFLFKGIMRDSSRSLLPLILISTGVMITSLYFSFIVGYEKIAIESSAMFDTGHIKVITRAYKEEMEQKPYDLCILGAGILKEELEFSYPQLNWFERIPFGGLVDVPDANGETVLQGESAVLAVDLRSGSGEYELLNLEQALRKGRLPATENEVILSSGLFEKLKIATGDKISLITATMYGAMAVGNYTVSGVVEFGIPALDRGMLVMDLSDARKLLDMEDGVSEMIGIFADNEYHWDESVQITADFNEKRSAGEDEFEPVMVPIHKQGDMESTLVWMRSAILIIIVFFIFIMGLVLWNLGLINGIRRYGEMGLRLAIGEQAGHIYWTLLLEAVILGLAGSIIGTLLGVLGGYYLENHPFDMTHYLANATVLMSPDVSAHVSWISYVIGFIPGFFATVLGAAVAGLAIFRRNTASLFKELES